MTDSPLRPSHASAADTELRLAVERALGGSYALGAELDGGGMARVFVAHDEALGRDVVVKVLAPGRAGDGAAERFAREARTAARLQEPHIVPVLGVGATAGGRPYGGLPYYTMPFVRGESLRARLARGGALAPREGVAVLRDVATALAYAHARGVVHRDLKPGNVLLAAGGAGPTALVIDFGIAKALRAAAGADAVLTGTALTGAGLTASGVVVGTPAYMAPEQAAADPALDARADLYAWGVVAYEALAGRHPFAHRPTPAALLVAHLTERPAPFGDAAPGVPAGVAEVVMRCLEKDPADRPGDAGAVLDALDAALAAPPGAADVWPAPLPRRRIAAHRFLLTEAVVRRLERPGRDPRLLDRALHYLENDTASDVLLFCVHGLGGDADEFVPLLERTPHRAVAPTLVGFEPSGDAPRVPLALAAHLGLLRAVLADAAARLRPSRVVLVGMSSGADLILRLLASASDPGGSNAGGVADAPPLRADACLALGPNLSRATTFASRVFAGLADRRALDQAAPEAPGATTRALLDDLRRLGADAVDLDEWLNLMTYQLRTLRKFRGDLAPLRRLATDIVRPFQHPFAGPVSAGTEGSDAGPEEAEVFAGWFRAASARVGAIRCVFEASTTCTALVQALRLRNLDDGVLGPRYREDALFLEPTPDHFALLEPARMTRHIDALLAQLA